MSCCEAETLANLAVNEDPRYVQGQTCLSEKNFEDAIELFSSLLQSCIESYGDLTPQCAKAYFEYGNALLTKEEETSAQGVLGNVDGEKSADDGAQPVDDEDDQEDGDEEGSEGHEEGEEDGGDEPEGDLQIAWEVLDVARSILEKQADADKNRLLSEIYVRLGDVKQMNEDIAGSLQEYESALKIRQVVCDPSDRAVSSIHYTLATTHLYNSKEKTTSNPIEEMEKALEHYHTSKKALELWLATKEDKTPQERAEVEDLVDVLNETIGALEIELKEEKAKNSSSSSSKPAPAATTTIGFGNSSSSSNASNSLAAKPKAATVQSISNSDANDNNKRSSQDVNTLAVKKRKPNEQQS